MVSERYAGAVLTGGASRRMGRDKALLAVAGVPMAVRVARALASGGAAPVVAVGGDVEALRALGLDARADPRQGSGPLGGLLTAFEEVTAPLVVVAACDLARLDGTTVRALVEAIGGADVAVAVTDRTEPLCAAWRVATAGAPLAAAFDRGVRAVHEAIAGLDAVSVAVDPRRLVNLNEPGDVPLTS
jgi:molybdenum cofactor guanylyltransferase